MTLSRRLLLFSFFVGTHVVSAGENVWTTNGPPGSVFSLAIDPASAFVFAGTRLGPDQTAVFRSSDHGESWAPAGEAPPSTYLSALNVATAEPAALYAMTADYFPGNGRVFRSIDSGSSWSQVGTVNLSASVLIPDPVDPRVLYAGGSTWRCVRIPCFSGLVAAAAVAKSVDSGITWFLLEAVPAGGVVTSLVVDPGDPNRLIAGGNGGIFVSSDGGSHWSSSNAGLGSCLSVTALAGDPRSPNLLIAGTRWVDRDPYSCGAVFRSLDGGRTWSPTSFVGRYVTAVGIDPQSSDTLYAATAVASPILDDTGVFQSTDGGGTWVRLGAQLPGVLALAIEPSGRALHAGTSTGVFDYQIVPGSRPPVIPPRSRDTRTLPARP